MASTMVLTDWFIRILAILEEERYSFALARNRVLEEVSTLFEPFDMSDVVAEADKQLGKASRHPACKRRMLIFVTESNAFRITTPCLWQQDWANSLTLSFTKSEPHLAVFRVNWTTWKAGLARSWPRALDKLLGEGST